MHLSKSIGFVLITSFAASFALAQEQTNASRAAETTGLSVPSTSTGEERLDVGAIVVGNLTALQPNDFADIIEDYAASAVTAADLATLVNRIASRARERGYVFASAAIEPQSLGAGVLRIRVEEGAIDEVRIKGSDNKAVRAQLNQLADGRPVTLARLERHLLLAGDVAGVRITRPRYLKEQGRRVLEVKATHQRFSGRAELSNEGTRPVGPVRAQIALDANALFSSHDQVDLTYATAPASPEELQRLSARYGLLVGSQGTELSLAASYSSIKPGAYLESREILGQATRVSAQLRHPLKRSRALSVWVNGEIDWTELLQEREGILARRNRVAAFRVGVRSRALVAGGQAFASLTLSQGLDTLGTTPLGDALSSRPDAAPDFTSLAAYLQWARPLSSTISILLAGQGLVSAGPLPITEDFGLGGTRFLRGYNFNERSGDRGVAGLVEMRYDWDARVGPFSDVQLYAFADGGVVGNLDAGRGSGSLASGGGGVRTELANALDIEVSLALPMTGPRFDSDDTSGRLLFSLGHNF